MKKVVLGGSILLFVLFFLIKSISYFRTRVRKGRTVESVLNKYEGKVKSRMKNDLLEQGLEYENLELSILAFKQSKLLELYGRNNSDHKWKLIKVYPFLGYSGELGPKLKEGDYQIPEGIYQIESLNPNSSYHLSLRVNYPNKFDQKKAKLTGRKNLGGDIMIHGKNVTIGCIPIGDNNIEELFVLSANTCNKKIPVIISPWDFRVQSSFPDIKGIEWSDELYEAIKKELKEY